MTLSLTERQLINITNGEVVPNVEVAQSSSLATVVCILSKAAGTTRSEMLLRLINRLRKGVSAAE